MNCDRCGNPAVSSILSFFNEDDICEPCKDKEVAHPQYDEAREAEAQAIKTGKPHNFVGIGLPDDLMVVKVAV